MDAAITGIVFGLGIPLLMAIGLFVMIVYLRKYENVERMAIIERGLDPKMFKRDKNSAPSPVLRWALLLIGAGLGLFLGYFLDEVFRMEAAGYFASLMIFGGVGLVIAYVIEGKKAKENL
jgi:hypothetical protein